MSFKTKKGEVLAIVGESGSGKSTILKLIYGEKDLDKGLVSWCDKKILGPKDQLIVGQDFMKYVAHEEIFLEWLIFFNKWYSSKIGN
jgi:ABC-type nitrate/sulfonate/bicarbonate transport system ATPase subunit